MRTSCYLLRENTADENVIQISYHFPDEDLLHVHLWSLWHAEHAHSFLNFFVMAWCFFLSLFVALGKGKLVEVTSSQCFLDREDIIRDNSFFRDEFFSFSLIESAWEWFSLFLDLFEEGSFLDWLPIFILDLDLSFLGFWGFSLRVMLPTDRSGFDGAHWLGVFEGKEFVFLYNL